MKLGYAILADAAEVSSDGKLTIMGGNIDAINAPSFPALHPKLSLVVNLLVEPSDLANFEASPQEVIFGVPHHQFRVECVEPDDATLVFAGVVPIPVIDIPKRSELPSKLMFVINSPPLVFRTSGIYKFRLYWDDQHLDDVMVLLREVGPNNERSEA